MPKKRSDQQLIDCVLKDWEGSEILLPKSVLTKHVQNAAHEDSHQYYETLKDQISSPESVVESTYRKGTKIANIRLVDRKHQYLHVVIRYGSFLEKMTGKKNFIVTFYPTDAPKGGKKIWPKST